MRNLILLLVSVVLLGLSVFVSAQTNLPNPLGSTGDFATLFNNIATYVSGFIGGLAILVFIWAGILYLTSGANPANVQKANKAVLYAVIGLAIAIAGTGLIALIKFIITG
jgi:hypothetical protein